METIEYQEKLSPTEYSDLLEAYTYDGPTILVALGTEMGEEDYEQRLGSRAQVISNTLLNRIANGVIENTVAITTGGYSGESMAIGSEAEIMLLDMGLQMEKLTEDTGIKVSIYGIDASVMEFGDLLKPQRIDAGHWAIPVYIDNKASSLLENLDSIPNYIQGNLIVLISGAARPSAFRAQLVGETKFPRNKVIAIEAKEESEFTRIKKALYKEGIAAGLKETEAAEMAIALLTKMGAGEFLNEITRNWVKK